MSEQATTLFQPHDSRTDLFIIQIGIAL